MKRKIKTIANSEVRKHIRKRMTMMGRSQYWVAIHSGMSPTVFSRYMKCKQDIHAEKLWDIMISLDIKFKNYDGYYTNDLRRDGFKI